MRVLISASTFPIRAGDGLPRFVYDLCTALAEHCEVTALVPDAPGAARHERLGAVEVHRFPYFLPRGAQKLAYGAGIGGNLRSSPLTAFQVPTFLLCEAAATRALVRKRRIDLVNSHWLLPQGLSTALSGIHKTGVRHVATLHGGDAYLVRRLPFRRAITRYVVERSDALLAVSSNVRRHLDDALGRASNATLQPMGVDVERFRAPATGVKSRFRDYILSVGRLVEIKGIASLIHALRRVREQRGEIGLVLVGSGPLEGSLRSLARDLGLEDAVEFTGALSHEGVAGHLQRCRVAVVSSVVLESGRAEGMPTVVPEALAAGALLVATRAGGVPDVVSDGVNGWLARPGDVDDLAAKILIALEAGADANASTGSSVRAAAARSADALDWSRVAARYLEIFEGALAGRKPA